MITAYVTICWVLTAVRVKKVKRKVPHHLWMGSAIPSSMNWIHFYRKEVSTSQPLAWNDVDSHGSIWEEYIAMCSVCFCTFGAVPGHRTGAGVATGSGLLWSPWRIRHCWRAGVYGIVSGLWSSNHLKQFRECFVQTKACAVFIDRQE